MANLIYYIYYKYYLFFKQINDEMPAFLAAVMMCWIFFMNIFTLYALWLFNTNGDIISSFSNKTTGIVFVIGLLLLSYFLFLNNNRYKNIFERFNSESKKKAIVGSLMVLLFTILSFWICLGYVVPRLHEIAHPS